MACRPRRPAAFKGSFDMDRDTEKDDLPDDGKENQTMAKREKRVAKRKKRSHDDDEDHDWWDDKMQTSGLKPAGNRNVSNDKEHEPKQKKQKKRGTSKVVFSHNPMQIHVLAAFGSPFVASSVFNKQTFVTACQRLLDDRPRMVSYFDEACRQLKFTRFIHPPEGTAGPTVRYAGTGEYKEKKWPQYNLVKQLKVTLGRLIANPECKSLMKA